MKWLARCSCPLALAAALLAARPAAAADVGFDGLASLSDVAVASLPGLQVSTALVLSEDDAALLTGADTQGRWATSPSNGLLNTLAASIRFSFDVAVTSFAIDILSLERDGVTLPIGLRGFDGATVIAGVLSDTTQIGDSGYHEQRLTLTGLFTSIELGAYVACVDPQSCPEGVPVGGIPMVPSSATSTFFADSASFTPVPEPGTLALLGSGLALLAGAARARGIRV